MDCRIRKVTLIASMFTVYAVSAPAQRGKAASGDPGAAPAVTVNGQVISRNEIVSDLLADQVARLSPKEAVYADKQRVAAGSVGAYLLKKMASSGSSSATVSKSELVKWLFEDKPAVLLEYVENRIRETVVNQEAKKKGVVVTQKEVDQRVAKAVKSVREQTRVNAGSDADVMAALGYRFSTVKSAIKTSLLLERLIEKDIETKLGRPIGQDDWVEARHVLVMPDMKLTPDPKNPTAPPLPLTPDEREKRFADAKAKALSLLADIRGGKKTFEAVAQEVNEDATKFKGGSLGIFGRGSMVAEFDKAVFGMKAGAISEPVRTQFGFHLIRVDRNGKEMTAPEREQARQQLVQSKTRPYVEELVRSSNVKNTLPPPSRGPVMQGG